MRKLKILGNKYFSRNLDDEYIVKFKVMMKHINNEHTTFSVTADGHEYIISNDKTHYDLLINDDHIQLVNTYDIIDIHVPDIVKDKILSKVRRNMDKERHMRIQKILSRKENTMDKILSKMD